MIITTKILYACGTDFVKRGTDWSVVHGQHTRITAGSSSELTRRWPYVVDLTASPHDFLSKANSQQAFAGSIKEQYLKQRGGRIPPNVEKEVERRMQDVQREHLANHMYKLTDEAIAYFRLIREANNVCLCRAR